MSHISVATETPQTVIDALNRVFGDRYHSLAAYVLEASPYVRAEDKRLLDAVEALAAFDREQSDQLAKLIETLGGVPAVGPYPRRIAELNYLSIQYLHRFLAGQLLSQIAAYTALLPSLQACPEARDAIVAICSALRDRMNTLAP